jgi:5-methylcytosine-specific restriction endonuclease McrA
MCKETKTASKFGKDRSTYDTLTGNCKKCRTIVDGVWLRNNPDKINAKTARRKASKLQRTPPWANKEAIASVYAAAQPSNLHVDHIVPLQGKRVSGLHAETNLQLLTATQNTSKGNRFNPDTYTHHIPQATGTESLAIWACLAPHRTQTYD